MTELLKKLKENSVEMDIECGPDNECVMVRFRTYIPPHYAIPISYTPYRYKFGISLEELESCRLSFEELLNIGLDNFLSGLKK